MKNIENKLGAVALVGLGIMPVLIEQDGTCLVLALCIAIPMFFAKKSWFYKDED